MQFTAGNFDVAVIGAGHAGIEAALASARLGLQTVIFSINLDAVGNMPCNPAIGGTAKGHLVREIDALGGEMGRAADAACIQYRLLNRGKGTALLAVGSMVKTALDAAKLLQEEDGDSVTVVNMRFVKPLDTGLIDNLLKDHDCVITLEDNVITGGFGEQTADSVRSTSARNTAHQTLSSASRKPDLRSI